MAHKKAGGSSRNGRDSNAQRLGVKRCAGQFVTGGVGANLPQNYLLLGQVTDGVDVPVAIQGTETEVREVEGGRPAAYVPVTDVVIESVSIRDATDDEISAYEELVDR